MNHETSTAACARYELRYTSLFNRGYEYVFPCDAAGKVDINRLSERARNNYLYVRAALKAEMSAPVVVPAA